MAKKRQQDKSAYAVLGLQKGASPEAIKQAYVESVKKYDPERHTDQFMVVQNAFDRLKDPAKRAREDVNAFNYIKGEFLFNRDERTDAADEKITEIIDKLKEQKDSGQLPAEKADPKLIQGFMLRSFKYVQKKLWSDAIDDWRRVLELDPANTRAKNNLYFSLITLGFNFATHDLNDEAVEVWKEAQQMNPEDPELLHNLALASEKAGLVKQASLYWTETVRRWKDQLEREPDNEWLKNCIIEALRNHGEVAEEEARAQEGEARAATEAGPARRGRSIEDLREILKLNPDDFEAQFQVSNLLMKEKRWDEAVSELEIMRKKWPRNVEVLNIMGWALLNSGKIDESFTTWRRARTIEPKNYQVTESLIKAHMTMGRTLRERGLFTPCLVHFKALLRYLPKSDDVHYEIAKTYHQKGDERSAYMEYQKAIKLNPKNKDARNGLASLRLQR